MGKHRGWGSGVERLPGELLPETRGGGEFGVCEMMLDDG